MHGIWQECRETYEIRLNFKEFLLYAKEIYDSNFDLSKQEGERGMLNGKAWWHFKPQLDQLINKDNQLAIHSLSKVEYLESDIRKALMSFGTYQTKNFTLKEENVKSDGSSEKRRRADH